MSVTATGPLSRPLQLARELLAASAKFQEITDSNSEAEALEHVYAGVEPGAASRPLGLASMPQEDETVSYLPKHPSGRLVIRLESNIPAEHENDVSDALLDFLNKAGVIREEMAIEGQKAGRLIVRSIRLRRPAMRSAPEEEASNDKFHLVYFDVDYGIKPG